MKRFFKWLCFMSIVLSACCLSAQQQQPVDVSYCDLAADPGKFDQKQIRINGLISHGFEDFQLTDPSCSRWGFSIWLTFGGNLQSGTMYCCPGEGSDSTRAEPLIIGSIEISLVRNEVLQSLLKIFSQERDTTTVKAIVTGYFFAGKKNTEIIGYPLLPDGIAPTQPTAWQGFGHLGCCSMLAIQKVEEIELHSRTDVDYSADGGWYDDTGLGACHGVPIAWRTLTSNAGLVLRELREAEAGNRSWAYDNPERVAREALSNEQKAPNADLSSLTKIHQTPSRIVYGWRESKKRLLTVIVTRPYWLSLYSTNGRVPWVTTNIKRLMSCN